MKKLILILLFAVASASIFAQSGTLLPNGFQIPRVASLTTCNNNAKATMVFLTTDNKLYVCNGTAWQGPSEFSIPYTTTASSNSGGLLNLTNTGTSWVLNTSISNIFSNANTLISFTAGTGSAGYFYTSNANAHAMKTYGALNFANIDEGAGKVLTSDASGNANWQYQNQVAFAAYSTTQNDGSDDEFFVDDSEANQYHTINFRYQDYDLGTGSYSNASNSFTAPFNGVYHFNATIKRHYYDFDLNGYYSLSIWKNNSQNIIEAFADPDESNSITIASDVKLQSGDVVNVKLKFTYSGIVHQSFISLYSDNSRGRFSGHLVARF
jgi:C1q domain